MIRPFKSTADFKQAVLEQATLMALRRLLGDERVGNVEQMIVVKHGPTPICLFLQAERRRVGLTWSGRIRRLRQSGYRVAVCHSLPECELVLSGVRIYR